MGKLEKDRLVDVLMSALAVRRDDDGDYMAVLPANDDYRYDVVVWFLLNEAGTRLQIQAQSGGLAIPPSRMADAFVFVNTWNAENAFGQAFVRQNDSRFGITATLSTGNEFSDAFLKEDFILLHIVAFWQFFKKAGKEF